MVPTLVILCVSVAVAWGGAVYWSDLQEKRTANNPQKDETVMKVPERQEEEEDKEKDKDAETLQEEPSKPEPPPTVVPEGEPAPEGYFADAAFVGDSLTQGIQLYDVIDTNVVANKGINLYTVLDEDKIRVAEGYTSVLKVLESLAPKKIYILLGANDIGWRSESDFKQMYVQLLEEIQKQHSDSIIYLQSMFPVTKSYSDTDNGITNEKLVQYNKIILEIAQERGLYYLDVASCLADDTGALPEEVSPDGMHLPPEYYKKWFSYLQTHTVKVTEE